MGFLTNLRRQNMNAQAFAKKLEKKYGFERVIIIDRPVRQLSDTWRPLEVGSYDQSPYYDEYFSDVFDIDSIGK